MPFRDDQISISRSQISLHVWGIWHAQCLSPHLLSQSKQQAPQKGLHEAYMEFLVRFFLALT